MQKKMPDSEWEKKERDAKYPVEITQRKGEHDVDTGNDIESRPAGLHR